MKRSWLTRFLYLGMTLVPFLFIESALAQNNVTFQVRMNIKMREQSFLPGSGDIVRVAGSFNGWGASTDTLRDADNDSIYTKVISLPTGSIDYKFLKTLRGGLDWESDPNRSYTVVAGAQTIPVVYFDRDSIYTPPIAAPVTFRVNMRVKILEGTFQPQNDFVRVAGSFNGWGSSTDTLRDVTPIDSIYQKTININEGSAILYKFLKTPRGGLEWEDDPNRTATVPTGGTTLPVVYFNRDSVVNVPITANIVWRVDMRALQNIGWFLPASGDSVQVRGGFNGWLGTSMAFDAPSQLYRVTLPYSGASFDLVQHKFFIKLDSVTGEARFPGYIVSGNRDGIQYDHPYENGDGNRVLNVQNGGNITTSPIYFSSTHRYTTLNNTTDTCRVTMKVNMGPATRYIDPFNPAADTLKLVFNDAMWWRAQVANQGSFPQEVRMSRQSPTDSVWTVSFKVKGKAHAGIMYFYRFIHPGGTTVNEGGGFVDKPYRARFIQATAPNVFPATYTAPTDSWQKDPPMFCETPQFGITDVALQDMGVPDEYRLNQNYPNPFNPATRITYSVPEYAKVTLKVFNLLGQEVATLVNQEQTRGNYVALFEANRMATGVYFYRLEAGRFTETKKMLLLR